MDGYPIQTNFSSGEISPLIYGRVDIARYANGAARLRNIIVKPQGPALRRSGTRFASEVVDSTKLTILKEFVFSTVQGYALEFGEEYIRIFKDGGILVDNSDDAIIVSTPYAEEHLRELDFTQSADVLYIAHPSYPTAKVKRLSPMIWEYEVIDWEDGPYLPVDTRVYTMAVQSFTDFATIRSTASDFIVGDVNKYVEVIYKNKLVLALVTAFISDTEVTGTIQENSIDYADLDPKAAVYFAAADGSTNFNIPHLLAATKIWGTDSENCFIKVEGVWYKTKKHISFSKLISGDVFDGMELEAVNPTVLTPTGIVTYHNRVITGNVKCSHDVFSNMDVGRHLRLDLGSQQVWCKISAIVSGKEVTVIWGRKVPNDLKHPGQLASSGKTNVWRFGAWYSGNYASCLTFHGERLVLANTIAQPQTFWMSSAGDYENMAPTDIDSKVLDDSAINFTLASAKVNSILWLKSGPVLIAGTNGAEWQIRATNLNEAITPTNINVNSQTEFGSELTINAERVGIATLFIQKGGKKLREMQYDFNVDAFQSKDVSIVSEHLLRERGGAIEMAFTTHPTSTIWIVTSVGDLVCITYEKDQEVVAWTAQTIAGSFMDGQSVVESICVVPTPTDDVVYLVVRRTINGVNRRYVEYLEKEFFPSDRADKTQMFFIDSGLSYNGTDTATVSGLDHLEGETVAVVADESYIGNAVVTSGSITLPNDEMGQRIQVGLPYRSLIETLSLEAGSNNGTAQGKTKRVHKVIFRVLHSLGFKHGSSEDGLTQHSFRTTTGEMDVSPPLYTGDISVDFDQEYKQDARVVITQDQPYPLIVTAIMPQLTTYK